MAVQTKVFNFFTNLCSYRSILTNRIAVCNSQPAACLRTETKNKLKEVPDKPKKPPTPFLRFLGDRRGDVVKKHPDAKLGEIAKILGQEWKVVNTDVKKKYEERYKNEMAVYSKENLEYFANLTVEQKGILDEVAKEKKHVKEMRKKHKFFKDTNKPKRVKSPFMLFIMEKSGGAKGGLKQALQDYKGGWGKLSPTEKQKYTQMTEDDKKRYEMEMEAWEGKMIKEGHTDMVRKSTLDHNPKRPVRRRSSEKGSSK